MKLNEDSKRSIMNMLINYIGGINANDELEITFKHKDDGEKDSIEFTCTKPSKDKQIKKSVYLHNNRIETTMFN